MVATIKCELAFIVIDSHLPDLARGPITYVLTLILERADVHFLDASQSITYPLLYS